MLLFSVIVTVTGCHLKGLDLGLCLHEVTLKCSMFLTGTFKMMVISYGSHFDLTVIIFLIQIIELLYKAFGQLLS